GENCASAAHRSLRSFFPYITDEGHIEVSPMEKLKRPKVAEPPCRTADAEVYAKLIETSDKGRTFIDARDAAYVRLILRGGLRRTEAANLKLDDVDLRQHVLLVRR